MLVPQTAGASPSSRRWGCADRLDRKVAVVLEELGLTYHSIYLDFEKTEQKSPEHIKYNPNGRIPTIIDHKNNDLVLWYEVRVWYPRNMPLTPEPGNPAQS